MTDKSLADAAFNEMDSDNDGVVTRSVLSAVFRIRIRTHWSEDGSGLRALPFSHKGVERTEIMLPK